MMFTLLFASLAAATTPNLEALRTAQWEPLGKRQHDEGLVETYKTVVGGTTCFRGAVTVDGLQPDQLVAVAADIESAPKWFPDGVTESVVLSREGNRLQFWERVDVPDWTMVADRFWFCEGEVETGPQHAEFHWDRMLGATPHDASIRSVRERFPAAIEPPVNVGAWRFDAVDDGVRASYSLCTEPGGSLPTWLQNVLTKRMLPDVVGELVRETRRRHR